jgi:hypothetical protein
MARSFEGADQVAVQATSKAAIQAKSEAITESKIKAIDVTTEPSKKRKARETEL